MGSRIFDALKAPRPAAVIAFIVGYALSFKLGEHAYGSLAVPSPFWLPDSVLLFALLVAPKRWWWIFITAIVPIRLLMGGVPGTPLWFYLATIVNDAFKALAAAWLLQRLIGRSVRLNTLNEFLIFLGVAGAIVPLLSALLAGPARYALGDPLWTATYQWFLGDTLAQVIVTPTMLYWWNREYEHPGARLGELLALSIGLSMALFYAFVVDHDAYLLSVMYAPVPFLIWAAVRLRPFGTANAIALVAVVSMLGAVGGTGVFAGDATRHSVLSLQMFLLVIAISLLSLAILTAERETLRDRERELNSRLIDAQERERAHIARELHDDLGQRLTLMLVDLEQFGGSVELSTASRQQLNDLAQLAGEIASGIHSLSHQLHPSTLEIVGLEIALKGLCREFSDHHRLQVQFTSHDVPAQLERDVRICLFRIVQEALHNVVKHSGVRAADVDLSRLGDRLVLCVSDSGVGFDTGGVSERPGLGLVSMRERLRPLGGRLSIQSSPLAGTRILVDVPLQVPVAAPPPVLELAAGN